MSTHQECIYCRGAWMQRRRHAVITQDICDQCASSPSEGDKTSLQGFLDVLQEPVLAVDTAGTVLTANSACQALLKKKLNVIEGLSNGDVVGCVNAKLPGGCSRTVHCSDCSIQKSLIATRVDGISRSHVEALQDFRDSSGLFTMRMFFTTEKFGSYVLLRIDSMNPRDILS